MRRVFLTGFMGSGKTTVGRLLAGVMDYRFIDLDASIVERAGASIAEIFGRRGEEAFRRLEATELERASRADRVVVATGGGTVAKQSNRRLMAVSGSVVWLNPTFETLMSRLVTVPAGQRPLLSDPNSTRSLFETRLPLYRESSVEVEIGPREGAESVALRIARLLEGESCAT